MPAFRLAVAVLVIPSAARNLVRRDHRNPEIPRCARNDRLRRQRSALARLETRVGLADHEDLAATAHDLAIAMARLGRLERGEHFHGLSPWITGELSC